MSAVRIFYRLVGFQKFLPGRFQYIAANSDTVRSEGGMVAKLGVQNLRHILSYMNSETLRLNISS